MTAAPVTVAVVSWNTRDLLAACLRSLEPDRRAGLAEVWVVDNASTDGSADLVRSQFPWVSLIDSRTNLGFGPAVNAVAGRAESAWIVAANADVAVTPGALATLVESGERDGGAGIVAPRLVQPDGRTQHSVHAFPTLLNSALLKTVGRASATIGDRLCAVGHWDEHRPRRVDWALGAFLLIRRAAFDAAGGFDADQWMYAEDIDIAWRMRAAGWGSRYEPRAVVRHAVSAAATRAFGDEREVQALAATYAWIARRRGPRVARAVGAINAAGPAVRAAIAGIASVVRPALAGERRRLLWHRDVHREAVRRSRASSRATADHGADSSRILGRDG